MRGLEFKSRDERQVDLAHDLLNMLKLAGLSTNSQLFFPFFRPGYAPEGPLQQMGLVAPRGAT